MVGAAAGMLAALAALYLLWLGPGPLLEAAHASRRRGIDLDVGRPPARTGGGDPGNGADLPSNGARARLGRSDTGGRIRNSRGPRRIRDPRPAATWQAGPAAGDRDRRHALDHRRRAARGQPISDRPGAGHRRRLGASRQLQLRTRRDARGGGRADAGGNDPDARPILGQKERRLPGRDQSRDRDLSPRSSKRRPASRPSDR